MNRTNFLIYKQSLKYHLKSARTVFLVFALVNILICFILQDGQYRLDFRGIIFSNILILVLMIPALILHTDYFFENFGQKLHIDQTEGKLVLNEKGVQHEYKITNVTSIERHLGIYYRNKIDRMARRESTWTPYGYILLNFDDGRQFFVTSLMGDILSFPLPITHTRFRFIPFIKTEKSFFEKRNRVNDDYLNEVAHYKYNFKELSTAQLEKKVLNSKKYQVTAIEAARQLLKERNA